MLSIFQLSVAQIDFFIIFCLILISLLIMAVAPFFSNNLVNQMHLPRSFRPKIQKIAMT